MAQTSIDILIRDILGDLRAELTDEFDQNFVRQSYFGQAWQRRRSPVRDGSLLQDKGSLRKNLRSRVADGGVTFSSSLPYAAIHNEGGEIEVTERMKRYFWIKYYEASGSVARKDGTASRSKRNIARTATAEFYRRMALMKVGQKIKMPRRQFIGGGPEVEAIVRTIIDDNLNEYLTQYENAKRVLSGRQ